MLSLYTIPQKSLKNLQENLISVYEKYIYESSVRSTLDKNQININTSTCIVIWFSRIYFLQVYWVQNMIRILLVSTIFPYYDNFHFHVIFFILSICSADLDVGWGLVTDCHWFHKHTRCNGKHGLLTLYRWIPVRFQKVHSNIVDDFQRTIMFVDTYNEHLQTLKS